MIAKMLLGRGLGWVAALCVLMTIAGCSDGDGDASSGDGDVANVERGGLYGGMIEKPGQLQGTIGSGNVAVDLYLEQDAACQTEGDPEQTTMSDSNGSYTFPDPVDMDLQYCISYDGNTVNCGCQWSSPDCDCSAP